MIDLKRSEITKINKFLKVNDKKKYFFILINKELYVCKEGRCVDCKFFTNIHIIHNIRGAYVRCSLPLDKESSYALCNPSWGYRHLVKIEGGV